MAFYGTLTTDELAIKHIQSLDEAISCLEFTIGNDGLYYYDAGHDEPWEACEGTIRENLQTLKRFMPDLDATAGEAAIRLHHEHRLYQEAFQLVLNDILARPGYVPLAERPLPEWKQEVRAANIENLADALNELEGQETADGAFYCENDGDTYDIDEAYCLAELEVIASAPALESDEGIDFWPYHNLRFWKQSLEIVLAEIREREKIS